jgi:AraC family transcriptional regulator, regulatory protein of adaptative response / DNA-3-methyladenine glycosylase II
VSDGWVERRLRYMPPLDLDRLFGFLGSRAIPGIERVEGATYTRAMRTPDGVPVVMELEPDPLEPTVVLRASLGADFGSLQLAARRLLDLDADPKAIDATLASDPSLRASIRTAPGTRVPGCVDGFEIAVRAIVGQQVSVAGARTTIGRIAERFGDRLDAPAGSVVRVFPTPAQMAEAPEDELGMPRVRGAAIVAVARAVERGELDLSGDGDPISVRGRLLAIRGVGEWTQEYVAMRALGDRDAFPVGDLGVRRGFARVGLADDARSMQARAERWRPWRAYAVIHLWNGPPSA